MTMPPFVELCARPREGNPCLGVIYRPQPDLAYCYRCGGNEPGQVYMLEACMAQVTNWLPTILDGINTGREIALGDWIAYEGRHSIANVQAARKVLADARTLLDAIPSPVVTPAAG